jgi:hypothetical protein
MNIRNTPARSLTRQPLSLRLFGMVAVLCCFSIAGSAFAGGRPAPASFVAQDLNGVVALEWTTTSEAGSVGFFLQRWDPRASRFVDVNARIIPALISSTQGGTYRYLDTEASTGRTLHYLLVEIASSGKKFTHGPFIVDTRSTAGDPQGADLLGDDALAHRGQSRKAHPKWKSNRARVEARERDRKRVAKHRKARKEQSAKIGVNQTGLYYVGLDNLSENGGLNVTGPGRRAFGLSNRGQEVSVLPSNDAAGFYFYGTAPVSNLEPDNVYRVSSRGANLMRSRRNPSRAPRPTGSEVFTRTVHVEQDLVEATNASSDPDGDSWVWDFVFAGYQSVSLPFRADGLTRNGQASLTVRLKGGVEAPGNPDHHASFSLNGETIGDVQFDGLNSAEVTVPFDAGLLVDGANVLGIEGLVTLAPYSLFYVDSFDVSYESRYRASGNRGEFAAAGNRSVFISGFTRADISVFDITDPHEPVMVTAPSTLHTDGTYGVVVVSADPSAVYYAATPDATLSPVRVLPDAPSSLKARNGHGEYLVITTEALMEEAQNLADYRADLRPEVIDIEDVYDEFNFGNASPYALRDFLTYAQTNWRNAPRFVVLAGDGTYDYKNFQGNDDNLIPVRMSNTPSGLYQDDSWFVAASVAADEPEIALGRLPVTTSEEFAEVIRKIVAREAAIGESWTQQALLLADDPDEAGNFVASLEGVASALPLGTPLVRAYITTDGVFGSRAKLINGINSGTGFVSYFGHGGYDQFAGESVFTTWDAPLLTNALRPAVMTAMTCLVGNSSLPGASSVGEALVRRPGGGLVALWGPSGWSENHLAEPLANEFYRAAFDPGTARIGDAVKASRKVYRASGWPAWMLSIYNLLGDPALRLH